MEEAGGGLIGREAQSSSSSEDLSNAPESIMCASMWPWSCTTCCRICRKTDGGGSLEVRWCLGTRTTFRQSGRHSDGSNSRDGNKGDSWAL